MNQVAFGFLVHAAQKMDEINKLVIVSYKAQCEWISRRIYDKKKKYYFDWTYQHIIEKFLKLHHPKKIERYLTWEKMMAGQQEAIDMFNETYYNLERRFEDGYENSEPVERIL